MRTSVWHRYKLAAEQEKLQSELQAIANMSMQEEWMQEAACWASRACVHGTR